LNDVFSIPGSDLSVNVNFGAITFMKYDNSLKLSHVKQTSVFDIRKYYIPRTYLRNLGCGCQSQLHRRHFHSFTLKSLFSVSTTHRKAFGEIGPLEALAASGQIKNMFSVCLLQENGTFSLGGIDESLYIGSIGFTPILSEV